VLKKLREKKKKQRVEAIESQYKNNKLQNIDSYQSILFIRSDNKIGDMVISTYLFKTIKKQNPEIKIGVIAGSASKDILENNHDVDDIFILKNRKDEQEIISVCKEVNQNPYDIVVDFGDVLTPELALLISQLECQYKLGFDKQESSLFNITLSEGQLEDHITKRYQQFLDCLNIKIDEPIAYYLYLSSQEDKLSEKYKNTVVVNLFGASKHRTFKIARAREVLEILEKKYAQKIIVLIPPGKAKYQKAINKSNIKHVECYATSSIREVLPIIKACDLVVTPDTSIMHIASAFNKQQINFYRDPKTPIRWGAIGENITILCSETDDINTINTEGL
jgi:ADP-heptose:LPS heptosyltransferase